MTGDNTLDNSHGINRRDFMKLCAALAATMGLSSKAAAEMAESVANPQRPPVIWIGAQECTGCTESLLRATHPTVENLVLETISLEYHEVLSAAFGHQVEENKHNALEKYKGQYVLVVDGSIPLKDNGIYCMVAGEPIVDHIRKAAEGAAAIIAIGSCSAWGGVAAAGLNPILAASRGATQAPTGPSASASTGGIGAQAASAASIPSAKTATMQAMYDYGNNTAQFLNNAMATINNAKQFGFEEVAKNVTQDMLQVSETSSKQISQTAQSVSSWLDSAQSQSWNFTNPFASKEKKFSRMGGGTSHGGGGGRGR